MCAGRQLRACSVYWEAVRANYYAIAGEEMDCASASFDFSRCTQYRGIF